MNQHLLYLLSAFTCVLNFSVNAESNTLTSPISIEQANSSIPQSKNLDDNKESYFLTLELEGDKNLEESFQPDWGNKWDSFRKECFFRDIVKTYEKAILITNQLNMPKDTIRLIEKKALIWAEQLDNVPAAIIQLLEAYKLSLKEDNTKVLKLSEKMHHIIDKKITYLFSIRDNSEYAKDASFHSYYNSLIAQTLNLKAQVYEEIDHNEEFYKEVEKFCLDNAISYNDIKASEMSLNQEEKNDDDENPLQDLNDTIDLINTASDVEEVGKIERAYQLYEAAGQMCMDLFYDETDINHLHPALAAGLCFEKNPDTNEQARNAFDLVIKGSILQNKNNIPPGQEKEYKYFSFVFDAPIYLQIALASFKNGNIDVFTDIICKQISDLSSIYTTTNQSNDDENEIDVFERDEDPIYLYVNAFKKTAEIVLKNEDQHLAKIKKSWESLPNFIYSSKTSLIEKQMEHALLSIFTAPKNTTVKKMLRLFDNEHLVQP